MGDRQYQQNNRQFRGGRGGGGGGYGGGGYDQQGYQHQRGGGRGGRGGGGGWQGGEGRGPGRGGYGRGPGGGPPHGGMEGGRGGGGGGPGGFQRSYIGGKRGRDDGPEGQPPKLSPQHVLVAKLMGVCDRNTNSARDSWTDERYFDDLLKSCRRDLEHGGDNVAGLLVEAAVEVSFKTQHYALVLGILNTERPDFSRRVTSAVIADLRACLAAPEPRAFRAKQLIRFLAALHAVNVVPADWILTALASLLRAAAAALSAAAEAAEATSAGNLDIADGSGGGGGGSATPARAAVQPYCDFLAYAALAALPWCGRDLAAALPAGAQDGGGDRLPEDWQGDEADRGAAAGGLTLVGLMALAESYLTTRPVQEDEALRPMMGTRSDEDLAAKSDSGGASFLTDLWSAITECRDNAWEVAVLTSPHGPYVEKLAAAQPLDGLEPLEVPSWPPGVDHALPTPIIAARVRSLYPARGGIRLLSREYLEGDLPAVERALVEEYVLDTLTALRSDRTACVLTLSSALPHHLASVFGPQRATVRNFVAEALFGQMLRLPSTALSHAAYCTLLVDLCKVPHFQFARALSSCVRELFGCMPYLDPELRGRLASWLSYHLSSFSYQWPWDRWKWVSERPPHDPQRGFCVLLVHRLLRLADYPVVKQSLPPYFQELLGPPPALRCPPLPGNILPHHQPGAHLAAAGQQNPALPLPPGGGQGRGRGGSAAGSGPGGGRFGGGRRGGGGDADPDLLEDEGPQGGGPQAMQVDDAPAAGGSGDGEGAEGAGRGPGAGAPPLVAAAWSGDPVAEVAARLVAWCRQEGSAVAAETRAQGLRLEQVAALWSAKVSDWLVEQAAEVREREGPLAMPQILITLILALGVKSPSHLHVAVERYAEALRSEVAAADGDVRALGQLAPGSWEATAAFLGVSSGQMAMMKVVRHYHSGEPQRLLLVTDRLLALSVLDGTAAVAALLADTPRTPRGRQARRARRASGAGEGGGEEAEEGGGVVAVAGSAAQKRRHEEEEEHGAGGEEEEEEEGGEETVSALSCFGDPVLSSGGWEVLLHVLDRLVALPGELPAEVEAGERKLGQLEDLHTGVLQSVAAGTPGLVGRERDVAAQVKQASRALEAARERLARSSAQAQDALLMTYLGCIRLLNRTAAEAASAAMDDGATSRLAATTTLMGAWVRALLRRYANDSAALLASGRLREEAAAHEEALGGPVPEEFVAAVQTQLGVAV